MSDHDTFDLDAAFSQLERDIADVTHSPGARNAVRGARSRRRTTVGAAVAGVALVGVAAAFGAGLGSHDRAVAPADHLPAPAPFDGPHLSAATQDWTPTWGPQTEASRQKLGNTFGGPCLFLPRHGRSGTSALTNGHVDVAAAVMSGYGSATVQEATDWRRMEHPSQGVTAPSW